MKASLSQIGRYRIDEKVGSGGMAVVYRAVLQGAEGFERRVALKVLHPHLSDNADYVRMFHEEARLASRMAHPVLVPVIDLGSVDGTHFMVMDLLEGETLADLHQKYRKKDKPFPRGHALYILAQVLDGLHYAHQLVDDDGKACGIVHRDVSPKNIVISRSGSVRLVDFGIARQDSGREVTRAGVVKGTVPYMAPEQAQGAPIDHRADLFAVGVILYHLITEEFPLEPGDTETQRIALAEKRLTIDPKQVHLKLRPIIDSALATEPENRFETAAAFADALRAALTELEPDYEPVKLVGLCGVRRRRKKRGAKRATATKRKVSRFRVSRNADTPKKRATESLPPWNGPTTVSLFAAAILLSAMLYTFMSGI